MQGNSVLDKKKRLFDIFNNWYAFPAGPVENDIYSYWYQKSINESYRPPDYDKNKEKYDLADFFKDQVAYEGDSKNKYNLKMLYFCCLMEIFYRKYSSFYENKIDEKTNKDKTIYLVGDVKQLLSKYFKKTCNQITADDLILLSHNLELWFKYYSLTEYIKIPTESGKEIDTDAMAFFLRVTKDVA